MKFASFIYNNKNTWGIVKDGQLVSVDEAILEEVPTLRSAISQEKLMEVGQDLAKTGNSGSQIKQCFSCNYGSEEKFYA